MGDERGHGRGRGSTGADGRRTRTRRARVAVAAGLLAAAACSGSGTPGSDGAAPTTTAAPPSTAYHGAHTAAATVEGPVTGGRGRAWRAEPDLPRSGFAEDEFFASGTAT